MFQQDTGSLQRVSKFQFISHCKMYNSSIYRVSPKLQGICITPTEISAVWNVVGDVVIQGVWPIEVMFRYCKVQLWNPYQGWEISCKTCNSIILRHRICMLNEIFNSILQVLSQSISSQTYHDGV